MPPDSPLAINGGTPIRTRPFPSWPIFDHTDEAALNDVLRSGKWFMADRVAQFEVDFAAYHGARFGVTVSSGTTALQVALGAVGVKLGDEVIVPSYTFVATASAVAAVGAVPVFVDIDANSYNIDPAGVEAAVTEKTKAIIAVHIGGLPADLDALMEIGQRRGIPIIEDACQAHGAAWKGRRVGAIGDIGCFSFQASKNLNCGEGGFVLSDDTKLAERAWSLHNCGRSREGAWYEHAALGSNYRLSEFQAALLSSQLQRLSDQTATRTANGQLLTSLLEEVDGIEPRLVDDRVTTHGYHLYILRFRADGFGGLPRERFIEALSAEGIPCSAGYRPLYKEEAFSGTFGDYPLETPFFGGAPDYTRFSCPVTERACAEESVWLTQNMLLGDEEDTGDIARAIAKIRDGVDDLL